MLLRRSSSVRLSRSQVSFAYRAFGRLQSVAGLQNHLIIIMKMNEKSEVAEAVGPASARCAASLMFAPAWQPGNDDYKNDVDDELICSCGVVS